MQRLSRKAPALLLGVAIILGAAGTSVAQDSTEDRLKALEERIKAQDAEIDSLREKLDEQQETDDGLAAEIDKYLGKSEDGGTWWEEPNASRVTQGGYLKFATADKNFAMQIGGRIMVDYAFFDADNDTEEDLGDFENAATEFRRARLFVKGTLYRNIYFKAQYDFAGGDADFKDMYIGLSGIPIVGHIQVGNQHVPLGFEEMTSSKYITFMERSMVMEAFSPSRKNGIKVFDDELEGRLQWAFMWFNDSDGYGDGPIANNYAIRIAGQPIVEDKGKEMLLHLGIAYALRKPQDDEERFRSRPEAHLASHRVGDTQDITDVDSTSQLGFEAAFNWHSFSIQSEYILTSVESDEMDDPDFSGFYIYASYFITGEYRPFKKGFYSRPKPGRNYDGDGGLGAWEVAFRFSTIDLDDGDLDEDALDGANNYTLGLNWYLNPNTRVMVNYVYSDVTNSDGLNVLQFRFQIDF